MDLVETSHTLMSCFQTDGTVVENWQRIFKNSYSSRNYSLILTNCNLICILSAVLLDLIHTFKLISNVPLKTRRRIAQRCKSSTTRLLSVKIRLKCKITSFIWAFVSFDLINVLKKTNHFTFIYNLRTHQTIEK